MQTDFSDNSFDVVWAIESVCYADDKKDFLKEAYRVLKIGGKLVVADGFLKRKVKNSEQHIYKEFLEGFILPNLALMNDFENSMKEVGFSNIKLWDKTKETEKSSWLFYKRCSLWYPVFKIARAFHLVPELLMKNLKVGIAQYDLVKLGLGGYGIFYGEKF